MTVRGIEAADVAARLADVAETFVTYLTGGPPTARHGDELRWGSKGSLAVEVRGARRGIWCDHEAGIGGDLLDLVRHRRGGGFREALEYGAGWLGLDGRAPPPRPASPPPPAKADPPKPGIEHARRLWREARPPEGTPAQAYLWTRRLGLPDAPVVRFHPACPRERERLPAMLALMTDPLSGEPVGVHRTFLRADGRGKAEGVAKMMLGRAGVVRLAEGPGPLGVAEGIETSLALIQYGERSPVWAACSAAGIARLPVLPDAARLTIYPDADAAGLNAARGCAGRWAAAGREAVLEVPPDGLDWHDTLIRAVAA